MRLVHFYLALVLLSFLDGVLSCYGVARGFMEERNPLMRWLMEYGQTAALTVKLLLTSAACIALAWASWTNPRTVRAVVYSACGVYTALVIYEVTQIVSQK